MSNIAVDLMGGDHAPESTISALVDVARTCPKITFHAVGLAETIEQLPKGQSNIVTHVVKHAIQSEDSLSTALRYKLPVSYTHLTLPTILLV